jgi:hypothetical protein
MPAAAPRGTSSSAWLSAMERRLSDARMDAQPVDYHGSLVEVNEGSMVPCRLDYSLADDG